MYRIPLSNHEKAILIKALETLRATCPRACTPHEIFDTYVLAGLLQHDVMVTMTDEQVARFTAVSHVDFPAEYKQFKTADSLQFSINFSINNGA